MHYPHLGAFESTKIHGTGEDILGTTRHDERWQHDLDLLHGAGVRQLRYSVPWHRIERTPGVFDWSWMDGPMGYLETHGMVPILDPLHHTSFPDWLEDGFANPEFPALYERFILELAGRYPWADHYTIFNEPLPTTLFCSYTGLWYPHQCSDAEFVAMSVNVGRAICQATQSLARRNPRACFVHVDTCESHRALDRRSERWVRFADARRFFLHDLILGRIDRGHPLMPYLRAHGFRPEDQAWFQDNPGRIDVLGLDYYFHSEMEWYWDRTMGRANISFPCRSPRGFAEVGLDYVEQFRVPVMLTETNIRGTVQDRLTWLRFMREQSDLLAVRGVDFRGFCWYPSIDSTDWCHCCTKCTYSVDPQGIWWLDDERWERHASELSECYALLAQGKASTHELPAYEFGAPLDRDLVGFRKLMRHWTDWRTPTGVQRVA